MPELSREHAQLTTMMRLMRYKVIQKMHHVRRKILPRRWWNRSTTRHRKRDQINHSTTAPRQRAQQLPWLHRSPVDRFRNHNAMTRADHLDPHTPCVMNVSSERPDSAPSVARHIHGPQLEW